MQIILSILFIVILILHGLIHLMGTITYLQLGTFEELAYKTTLLNGSWDVGQAGIAIFGTLWAVAALGFLLAAAALLANWNWARPVLMAVTLFSLVLTILDWNSAFAGIVLNGVILTLLLFGPHLGASFVSKELANSSNR